MTEQRGDVALTGAPSYRAVLRHREFGALFAAHLLSLLGDRLATVAISVLVYQRSGSVLLTATAYATSLLPWLLGAPFLAALADRWPRRRVLISCDLTRAVLVLALAVPGQSLAALLLLLTAVAWLGPPFDAARAATLTVVLPDERDYVAGSALTMLSNQASQVIGLAGGGLLLAVVSMRQALLIDCATFLLSAALIRLYLAARPGVLEDRDRDERPGLWQSVVESAQFTFGDPLLRSVLLLAWLVAAFTVVPEGLAVAAAGRLDAPSAAVGLLMAAVPTGAAMGAVLLGRLGPGARERSMLPLAALGMFALVASAAAGSWPVLLLAWLVVGFGAAVQLPASARFMLTVPDAYRTRAFGLAMTGLMAGQGLTLLLGGAMAQLLGIPGLLAAAGVLGLLLLALLVGRWPQPSAVPGPATVADDVPQDGRGLSPVDIWIGIVVLAATGAVVAQLVVGDTRPAPWTLSPWLLGAAFFATGSYVATVRIGRQAHVFQLDDIPRLLGLVFISPAALIASRLGGALVALVGPRRQRGRKLVFNLANFGLEVAAALTVFELLDPGHGVGPAVWPAALAATVVADLMSASVVGTVIGLAEGDLRLRRVLTPDRMALGTAVGAATVGMIAATTLWYAPASGALILVLVILGMLGLRAFARLAAEGQEQERLQVVLSEMANLEATTASLRGVLEAIRSLLAVEALACWIAPAEDGSPLRGWFTVQAPDSVLALDVAARDDLAVRALFAAGGRGLRTRQDLVGASPAPVVVVEPPLTGMWQRRRPHGVQRLSVALPGTRARLHVPAPSAPPRTATAIGALVATGPIGDGRTFDHADTDLLQTIAGMLTQAVQRVEQRHQLLLSVTEDRLTRLPTLSEFRRAIGPLLTGPQPTAVFMINLVRLRAVNDVFGRDTGDRVIAAAANRTRRLAPEGSVLGRVSGHHLACAFPLPSHESIRHLARQLRRELQTPFATEGVDAEVGVHIGISLSPDHGHDPDVLLRRAETAVDAAKEDPFGVAVFVPDLEQDVARPLRLVRDLRAALETEGQLAMHYQPKQSLLTGDVLGCEALIRWSHPELGNVPPDEFVTLAESTGLITEITAFTLDQALKQSARWQQEGLPSAVAVNLSARSLLDDELVESVVVALDRYGVDPSVLTLEITETNVMAQPKRSVLMLDALRELGVQLSIDDFGTGYSNLTYLRQLPVQEVKLDRTFLSPLRGEAPLGQGGARAFEFLRHAVALVHSLGLYVVVEGVEDRTTLDALQLLGADSAQGYFICRPLPAEGFATWMAQRAMSQAVLDPPPGA
jgi:diguanylate cyclase (GGDEF)-like protein